MTDIKSVIDPMYNIANDLSFDRSTDSLEYMEIYDINNSNNTNANSEYDIEISQNEHMWHLHNAFVQVVCKLTNTNGANFGGNENISIQNNLIGLFRRWRLLFDNIEVENVDDTHLSNTIRNLINFSKDYSESIGQSLLWYPDTADNANSQFTSNYNAPIISLNNIVIKQILWRNSTQGNALTVLTVTGVNAYISVNGAIAADQIQAFISFGGIEYPVRFFAIRTDNGIYRASTLNLTVQDSDGAGALRLCFNGATNLDYIIAIVDTFGLKCEFKSANSSVVLSAETANGNRAIKVGNGTDAQSFTGVVALSSVIETATMTIGNTNDNLDTVNYGHRKRRQLMLNSKLVSFNLPLKHVFGFVNEYKGIMKGTKINLRLERARASDIILGDVNGLVYIDSLKLFIPRVKPNSSIYGLLEQKLSGDKSYFIPYHDTQFFRSQLITTPMNKKLFQITSLRKMPTKLYIAMQLATRIDGPFGQVKRIFDNVNLNSLMCVLNSGTQYPDKAFTMSFDAVTQDYARIYNSFIECGLKHHDITQSSIVNFDNYPTLFPIFCIDLSKKFGFSRLPDSAVLDIYLSNTVTSNFYIYCLVEAERQFEMVATSGSMKAVKAI